MNKLKAAIDVYRKAVVKTIDGRVACFTCSSDEYENCKAILSDAGLFDHSDDNAYKLEFSLPIQDNSFFAKDLADLLEKPSRKIFPPDEFFVADLDFHYSGDASLAPLCVRQYLQVATFAQVLVGIADLDVSNSPRPKIVFLHGEKLELSLMYDISDLKPLDSLDDFVSEFIKADIHKDQKSTIIKSVLLEMLSSNRIDRLTLACLINRFEEFYERVKSNYQLYVSEFSFEKIKSKVEQERLDFTLKLNKIMSDIQNQLLAIPVALIIVGSQMTPKDSFVAKNIVIWVGSLVFAFFISLLIRNQRNSLGNIKMEIDHQWAYVSGKHVYVRDKLKGHYFSLKCRYYLHCLNLMLISLIVACGVVGSTFLLYQNSNGLGVLSASIKAGLPAGALYALLSILIWFSGWVWCRRDKLRKLLGKGSFKKR